MTMLAKIVGSRIRAEIFRLLFAGAETELHAREIQRRTGFNDRAIRQELEKLCRLDLVTSRRDGNRLYFRANRANPLYREIRGLAIKTSGIVELLRQRLRPDTVHAAFAFGSIAQGRESAASDIDLVIVGRLGLRGVTELLSGAADELGREINPHVFTPEEFRERLEQNDHFATSVLAGPKIMIKGNTDELGGMGAKRLVAGT
jgi:predicted nucleotidyltransferase